MDRGGVQACAGVDYLEDERRNPGFSVEAMRVVVWGGEERARAVQQLSQLVAHEPVFSKDDDVRVTRADGFKRSFAKAKHEHVLATRLNLSLEHRWLLHLFIDDVNYTALHWHMFIPAIEGQASEAQAAEWLPLARSCAWLGCYAQTEMGHGSNVQGLETTATFLPDSDEFDLHSPTLTSTKWWPGGLGKVSTHAIVYARLVLAGKDHGVHAFLVQLRSLEDHTPLRGVTVGDIGTKFGNGGYNTMDNGFVSFRHVRIPRTNMLMRYTEVTREGQYRRVSGVSRQLAYGAMVYVRKGLVLEAGLFLARAVTIATRYSCVRRQFGASPPTTTQETKVMDYATQQLQVVVLLARAYAFIVSGQWMNGLYDSTMASIRRGDTSTLPEVHAATAGLKALTTAATADGIEECRKLCGGHGYLCASGLPQLFAVYVPACTYEGDNTVLMLQVARYLLKAIAAVAAGNTPSGTAAYLAHAHRLRDATMSQQAVQAVQVVADGSAGAAAAAASAALLEALQARAVFLVTTAAEAVAAANSIEEGFHSQSVALVKASRAHCQVLVATNFFAKAEEVGQSPSADAAALSSVLRSLADVYALATITEGGGAADLLEAGYLQPQQPRALRQALTARVASLRPRTVPLVDSFGFTDHYLNSDLGRHDGDVYTHLHRRALNDPINAQPVVDGYEEHLRPLLKGYAMAPASGASRL